MDKIIFKKGKYKDKTINEVADLYYLQSLLRHRKIPLQTKFAIQSQIDKIEWLAL